MTSSWFFLSIPLQFWLQIMLNYIDIISVVSELQHATLHNSPSHVPYFYCANIKAKVQQSSYRPRQLLEAARGCLSHNLQTIGAWRWWGCKPYTPTSFTLPVDTPGTHTCHGGAGSIRSMKNLSDPIENQNPIPSDLQSGGFCVSGSLSPRHGASSGSG